MDWSQVWKQSCGQTNQSVIFFLENMNTTSFRLKRRGNIRLVISAQFKILHLWGCGSAVVQPAQFHRHIGVHSGKHGPVSYHWEYNLWTWSKQSVRGTYQSASTHQRLPRTFQILVLCPFPQNEVRVEVLLQWHTGGDPSCAADAQVQRNRPGLPGKELKIAAMLVSCLRRLLIRRNQLILNWVWFLCKVFKGLRGTLFLKCLYS